MARFIEEAVILAFSGLVAYFIWFSVGSVYPKLVEALHALLYGNFTCLCGP